MWEVASDRRITFHLHIPDEREREREHGSLGAEVDRWVELLLLIG